MCPFYKDGKPLSQMSVKKAFQVASHPALPLVCKFFCDNLWAESGVMTLHFCALGQRVHWLMAYSYSESILACSVAIFSLHSQCPDSLFENLSPIFVALPEHIEQLTGSTTALLTAWLCTQQTAA